MSKYTINVEYTIDVPDYEFDKNDTDAVIQFTKGALIKAWNSRSDNA